MRKCAVYAVTGNFRAAMFVAVLHDKLYFHVVWLFFFSVYFAHHMRCRALFEPISMQVNINCAETRLDNDASLCGVLCVSVHR